MNWNFFLGLVAGSGIYAALKWIYDCRSLKKKKLLDSQDDCFLFSPHNFMLQCQRKQTVFCKLLSCPVCNFRRYLALIKSAKTHLDVCIYLITSQELARILINLSCKGVFVRIIVDKEMSDQALNSKMCVFVKEHIPTKIVNSGELMHNKFVIIDKKMVVTGSFNWTKQATSTNYENGVVIHNEKIVKKFTDYFEDIWLTPDKIY